MRSRNLFVFGIQAIGAPGSDLLLALPCHDAVGDGMKVLCKDRGKECTGCVMALQKGWGKAEKAERRTLFRTEGTR